MRLARLLPLLALLLASLAHGQTRWGEAQIALHGGAGNITLDDYDDLYDTNGTLAFGISAEYVSTFHVLLEIGWEIHNQDADLAGLEDSQFYFNEFMTKVGVEIPIGEHWHIEPKIGRVYWRFNGSSDDYPASELPSLHSTQDMWELSVRRNWTDHLSFGGSYRVYDLPGGHVTSATLDLRFRY